MWLRVLGRTSWSQELPKWGCITQGLERLELGALGRGGCMLENAVQNLLEKKRAAGTYTWISSSSQVCSAKIELSSK